MGNLATKLARATVGSSRILTIDIERLPGLARAFDARTEYIRADQWVEAPRTICFAARWYGDKTPIFEAEWLNPEAMIQRSWELYDQADAVQTFNGKRFDNKHLKAMWFEAGLPLPRPWKDIDLFPIVKQFGYVSSSLDYVTRRLGRPGKVLKYDVNMALAAVDGNERAQQKLRRYNLGDVELTHLGAPSDDKSCNQCGSTNLKLQPTRYRAVVIDYALYRCQRCGGNIRAGWHAKAAPTRGVR
jgi:DNA polymerase elongation subunit (family B)